MSAAAVIAKIVRVGAEHAASALEGQEPDAVRIVRSLVGLGLDLMPIDELKAHLDAEAARRIDAEVDLAVEVKLSLIHI